MTTGWLVTFQGFRVYRGFDGAYAQFELPYHITWIIDKLPALWMAEHYVEAKRIQENVSLRNEEVLVPKVLLFAMEVDLTDSRIRQLKEDLLG